MRAGHANRFFHQEAPGPSVRPTKSPFEGGLRGMSLLLMAVLGLVTLLGAACSPGDTLVVYSPHGPEMRGEYAAQFEAENPGVRVHIMPMSSQEVFQRISGERNRPACDVWWGAPSTMFAQAASEGLLAPYTPSWAEGVPEAYRDPQDRWYGTFRLPIVIVFNDRHYTPETAPQSWDELAAPEWRDKVAMRRPLESGTLRTFIAAMIIRAGSEEAGLDYLRALHENTGVYLEKPQFLFDHIRRNPEMVTVWLMTDAVMQRELNNYPFGFVVPPDTPVITDGIGIVEGAPRRDLAERFYEFVTTREALTEMANEFSKLPARLDIPQEDLPEWATAQSIDELDMDWAEVEANIAAWCERWEREVYGER